MDELLTSNCDVTMDWTHPNGMSHWRNHMQQGYIPKQQKKKQESKLCEMLGIIIITIISWSGLGKK